MKTTYRTIFFFFGLAIPLILASCLEESDDAPFEPAPPEIVVTSTISTQFDTLAYTGNELEVEPLDKVSFEISVTAEGVFAGYSIYLSIDGAVADTLIEVVSDDLLPEDSSITFIEDKRSFEIPTELINNDAAFRFVAFDQLGQSGDQVISVTVRSPRARFYEGIRLFEPTADLSGSCFFQSRQGIVYDPATLLEATGLFSSIDFGYYYGLSDSVTIASPKSFEKTLFAEQVSGWETLNATLMRSTSQESLDGIVRFEDIDVIFDQGIDESGSVTDLQPGAIIAFETVRGKRGLVSVREIIRLEDSSELSGYIELDILVQERVPRN